MELHVFTNAASPLCFLYSFEGFAICSINGKRVDGVEQFQGAWEKATVVKDDPEIKKRQRKQSKEATYQKGITLALEVVLRTHSTFTRRTNVKMQTIFFSCLWRVLGSRAQAQRWFF